MADIFSRSRLGKIALAPTPTGAKLVIPKAQDTDMASQVTSGIEKFSKLKQLMDTKKERDIENVSQEDAQEVDDTLDPEMQQKRKQMVTT